MATFVLIPGAGGAASYWSLVAPRLRAAGHGAIAVALHRDDPDATLRDYAALIIDAMPARDDVVLVAQSFGGFSAAMVCARVPVQSVVFVNAMIPVPRERPDDWWGHVGAVEAREAAAAAGGYGEFDVETYFFHDVPPDIIAATGDDQHPESDAMFASVCEFDSWPPVPLRVLAGADDRFFPAAFQRRVARDRLGVEADVLPGGHLIALSQPAAVTAYLLA